MMMDVSFPRASLGEPAAPKIHHLKILTTWLLEPLGQRFDEYSYGCHCSLEQNAGKIYTGKPVDPSDRACRDHSLCYRCLRAEYNAPGETCDGNSDGYRADLYKDIETDKRWVECKDSIGSCRKNICECDKALAQNLLANLSSYDPRYYISEKIVFSKWFDKSVVCSKQKTLPEKNVVGRNKEKKEKIIGFVGCCGDRTTFPYNQSRKSNQCCQGFEAQPEGTCRESTLPQNY